jgi:hypothetical protein
MDERGAGKKAEKLERAGRAGGGTAERTGAARQASVAPGEQAGDEALGLMEEVLRRENLKAALLSRMGLVSLVQEKQRLASTS